MSDFTIRPFTEADRPAVLALAPQLVDFRMPSWHDPARVLKASEQVLEAMNSVLGDNAIFVAESGMVLGFVEVRRETEVFSDVPQAYVSFIAVAESAQRRGVGRALLGAAENWAREQGLNVMSLHLFAANSGARAFYEQLGFQEDIVKLVRIVQEQAKPARYLGSKNDR